MTRLSDTAIKKFAETGKLVKKADGGGLYIAILPSGYKSWRFDYQLKGKRRTLTIGPYPEITLAQARNKREELRSSLKRGFDPAAAKKLDDIRDAMEARSTFGLIVDDYLDLMQHNGAAAATVEKNRWMLKVLAQDLENRPAKQITAPEILTVLRAVEKRGRLETARRLRGAISSVFQYAVATMRATEDPTIALRKALKRPKVQHRAALVEERDFGRLMMCIKEDDDGWPIVRLALLMLAFTAARPGEVRFATWDEFDLAKRTWTIPPERMKTRREHEIPLNDGAMSVLREAARFRIKKKAVFPSQRYDLDFLSENALNTSLRRIGFGTDDHTAHGFRSSFSTILNERGHDMNLIEICLAHIDKDKVRRAYNRSQHWERRVELMRVWGEIVEDLASKKSKVVQQEFEDLF